MPSPTEDVPSPGDTPPNVDVEDMDMSDDEANAPGQVYQTNLLLLSFLLPDFQHASVDYMTRTSA